jgi:mono/diheme cytochrome c family protein
MKKLMVMLGTILSVALVGAVTWPLSAGTASTVHWEASSPGDLPEGQRIFLDQRCDLCHDVSNVGIEATTRSERLKGGDIKGLDLDPDWLAQYLKKEVELDGKAHQAPRGFAGTDEELKILIDWVLSQE